MNLARSLWTAAPVAAVVVLVALAAGCRPPPAPPPEAPPETSRSAQPSASASAPGSAAPAASAPVAPRRVGEGCWGVELAASPVERLAQLGKRCAQGLKPVWTEARRVEGEVALPALPAGACLRVIVASAGEVSAELRDAQGGLVASDRGPGLALLDPQGPVCLGKGEPPRLVVQGQGEAWLQVWSSKLP